MKITNLSKGYASTTILDRVNAEFPRGQVSFVMGRNGAGKTTLMRCLLGLEEYTGTVTFGHRPVDECRPRIYAVFDDCPFHRRLNGHRNLQLLLGRSLSRSQVGTAAAGLLSPERLRAPVSSYSFGERKKLAVTGLLLSQAEFILLDEISNGLDFEARERLSEGLAKCAETASVLVTGHDFAFFNHLVGTVYVLDSGDLERISDDDHISLEDVYRRRVLGNRP